MPQPQPLQVGENAPDFTLPSSTGESVQLSSFRGKSPVVLYFYPKDNTPGCTVEACSFRDAWTDFQDAGAVVLGVSPDDLESHAKFAEKHHLSFPLLYDEGGKVATSYGAYGEKSMYGKTYKGNYRVTYLIGKDGSIAHVWAKVKPEGHAEEVLAAIEELGA